MKEHCKDIVRRQFEAQDNFIEILQNIADISKDQAVGVFDFMLRHKMVKLDTWMGRYSVKHGGMLDKDFIEHLALHGAF
jgi:hypothetical protein